MHALTFFVLLVVFYGVSGFLFTAGDKGDAAAKEARFQQRLSQGNNMAIYLGVMAPLWLVWVGFAVVYVPFWKVDGFGSAAMWALGIASLAVLIAKATRYLVVGSEEVMEAKAHEGDES